jgi:hypothetical protein
MTTVLFYWLDEFGTQRTFALDDVHGFVTDPISPWFPPCSDRVVIRGHHPFFSSNLTPITRVAILSLQTRTTRHSKTSQGSHAQPSLMGNTDGTVIADTVNASRLKKRGKQE